MNKKTSICGRLLKRFSVPVIVSATGPLPDSLVAQTVRELQLAENLRSAVERDDVEIAEILLKQGANPNCMFSTVVGHYSVGFEDDYAEYDYVPVLWFARGMQMEKLLREYGAKSLKELKAEAGE